MFTAWPAADDRLGEHQRVEVGADRVELGQTLPATEGPADRLEQGGAALDEFGRPVVGPEDHILVHEGAEEQRGARLPGSWRGKVNQEYLDKRGDTSVRLNEVVRVSGKEVRLLVLVRTMPEGRSQLD